MGTQTRVGTGAPVDVEQDKRDGPPEGPILLLFTILTLAASAFVLISEEQDAVSDPAEKAARGEIRGLDAESLLRKKNLQRALDDIGESKRPLVSNLRVSAVRVNATVRDADGFRKVLAIDPGFDVDTSDFGVGEDSAVPASRIDAAAPERMVRAVVKRTRLDADAVDYVTISLSSGADSIWYMALKEGPARVRQWVAAPNGTDLRKPGDRAREQGRR